jgi:hypothetical protein
MMHSFRFLLCFFIFISFRQVLAQTVSPNSLNPGKAVEEKSSTLSIRKSIKHKRKFFSPSRSRDFSRRRSVKHTPEYEFYERVERAAREKKMLVRKLYKPQYSDFRYFGHKKIPTRRKPNKMRYCDECGIRH